MYNSQIFYDGYLKIALCVAGCDLLSAKDVLLIPGSSLDSIF